MMSASLDGVDLATLRFPLMVSPKLDGVRCVVWEGVAYSRNAKPIRNRFVQKWAADYHNIDGELIVGSPTEGEVLGRTQSGVMSYVGEPDFSFHLFDSPDNHLPFDSRLDQVQAEHDGEPRIVLVPHHLVEFAQDFVDYEELFLKQGYEGMMVRHPDGPYKHGRSTLREGWLMKLKRFTDGEAVVTGLEESMENTNELQTDELGRAKRSHRAEGLVGKGMIGTLICEDKQWGRIRVAPGIMDHTERRGYWEHRFGTDDEWRILGKTIHWRSFGYGVKDKPRFPRFYGVREDL
jgi:DNA ligase-1